jgi:hypothetical protein
VPRFELLYRSLQRHVSGLDRIWVVVPPHMLGQMQFNTAGPGPVIELVSELALVPELALFTRLSGWYRQQLVKLEAANRVQSDFYLTLDADVIATQSIDLNALCAAGTAPCGVVFEDLHPRWYEGAEALIGARLPRQGISHAVTPTILHRDAARSLMTHLDQRWNERRFSPGLRGLKQRFGRAYAAFADRALRSDLRAWRMLLCCSRPWSEYSLYYSFLEWSGRFAEYHHETKEALYTAERSIWHPQDVARWDPSLLAVPGPPFVVLQSTAGIPLDTLRSWLAPYL